MTPKQHADRIGQNWNLTPPVRQAIEKAIEEAVSDAVIVLWLAAFHEMRGDRGGQLWADQESKESDTEAVT